MLSRALIGQSIILSTQEQGGHMAQIRMDRQTRFGRKKNTRSVEVRDG